MEITLDSSLIVKLTWRGVIALVAVKLADGSEVTTAALAALVKCQTAVMLEGLKEVAVEAPELVGKVKNKWRCGVVKAGDGVVLQNLESERYRAFVDDLKKYWDHLNPELPFSMGGKDGLQIRGVLADHKEWTQDDWRRALTNRKVSVVKFGVGSRSEPLWCWVGYLGSYVAGPIDKFRNQVNGNGKAAEVSERNRQGNQEYVARRFGGAAQG